MNSSSNGNGGKRGSRLAPSIISGDLTVHGALTAGGDIQVDGTVDGDISSHSLTIGEKATVHGEILCEEVIVRGRVIGTVRAMKVQLSSTAHVEGDIFHNALAVEAGAFYEGNCRHSEDPLNETIDPVNALPVSSGDSSSDEEHEDGGKRRGKRSIVGEIFAKDDEENARMAGDGWARPASSSWVPDADAGSEEKPRGSVARATTVSKFASDGRLLVPGDEVAAEEEEPVRTPASVKAALKRLTGVNARVAEAKAELEREGSNN